MSSNFFTLLIALLLPVVSSAQNSRAEHQSKYSISIKKTATAPRIDGLPDEAVWQTADTASYFHLKWPRDGAPAPAQTEVRCLYDDKWLYISAIYRCRLCHQ
jgi:hypothetical protein